jgi:hypothetical protein
VFSADTDPPIGYYSVVMYPNDRWAACYPTRPTRLGMGDVLDNTPGHLTDLIDTESLEHDAIAGVALGLLGRRTSDKREYA